jgi:hypothetical protein
MRWSAAPAHRDRSASAAAARRSGLQETAHVNAQQKVIRNAWNALESRQKGRPGRESKVVERRTQDGPADGQYVVGHVELRRPVSLTPTPGPPGQARLQADRAAQVLLLLPRRHHPRGLWTVRARRAPASGRLLFPCLVALSSCRSPRPCSAGFQCTRWPGDLLSLALARAVSRGLLLHSSRLGPTTTGTCSGATSWSCRTI